MWMISIAASPCGHVGAPTGDGVCRFWASGNQVFMVGPQITTARRLRDAGGRFSGSRRRTEGILDELVQPARRGPFEEVSVRVCCHKGHSWRLAWMIHTCGMIFRHRGTSARSVCGGLCQRHPRSTNSGCTVLWRLPWDNPHADSMAKLHRSLGWEPDRAGTSFRDAFRNTRLAHLGPGLF